MPRTPTGRRVSRSVRLLAALVLGGLVVAGVIVSCGYLAGIGPAALVGGSPQLDEISLPDGFAISVFAEVEGARSLAAGPPGVVFVGSRDPGKVYAIVDEDHDGRGDDVHIIAEGLRSPNGVAWHEGDLYVAEIARILRYVNLAEQLESPPIPEVVYDRLPDEEEHGWKYLAVSPDGWLYVPVGAPCNVCERSNPVFASILRMRPDGTDVEIFAQGIRNTVGFDWHPEDGTLWFTDNGRDWMGDDRPPDELNRAPQPGMHFGFPYCHGRDLPDDEHDAMSCDETAPPLVELEPHVAALGMRFYMREHFPPPWRDGIFIAEHGSWNRTDPTGYRIVFVPVHGDRAGDWRTFADGWLDGPIAWGRPVDVEVLPDGSLLVSDDKAGLVYRITYRG